MTPMSRLLAVVSLFGGFVGLTALVKGYEVLRLAFWIWPKRRSWTFQVLATHVAYLAFLIVLVGLPGGSWTWGTVLRLLVCFGGLLACLWQQLVGFEAIVQGVLGALRKEMPGAVRDLPVDMQDLDGMAASFSPIAHPFSEVLILRIGEAMALVPTLLKLVEATRRAQVGDVRAKWYLWALFSFSYFRAARNTYRAAFWQGAMEAAEITTVMDLRAARQAMARSAIWLNDQHVTGRREGFQYLDRVLNASTMQGWIA